MKVSKGWIAPPKAGRSILLEFIFMLKKLKTVLKALGFFAFGFGILYLLYRSQDKAWQAQCALDGVPADQCHLFEKLLADFAGADFRWIAVVALIQMVSHLSRTMRWRMLVQPLGYQPGFLNSFFSIGVAYFANLGFPRIGEVVRAVTLSRYERIPAEKVMGTVVVDRVADGLTMFVVIGLALLFESGRILELIRSLRQGSGDGAGGGVPWLWIILIAGVAGLAFLWIFRKRLKRLPVFRKFFDLLEGFGQGIETIRHLERPFWFIFHSVNVWLMYYLAAYIGLFAFAPTSGLGPLAGLMVFAAGTLGFTVPSPGGMGTYHLMVMPVLTFFYGIQRADAFSFANIIFFSIQIGVTVLFGVVSLVLLPLVNKRGL